MKGLIVNVLAGGGLFVGGIFGTLAATGRLNHDGVANIPILNSLFPAPPVDPNADPNADPHAAGAAKDATGEHGGAPQDAPGNGEAGHAEDASHAAPSGETGEHAGEQGQGQGQEGQGETKPLKRGKSLFETEPKKGGGGHGGGEEGGGGEHGDKAKEHGGGHEAKPEGGGHGGGEHGADPKADGKHAAERDFDHLEQELQQDRRNQYAPGGYFRFDGMPSGITPEKLNEAWTRVQSVMTDLDKRAKALDLREKELREFADDIARRQTELGKERVAIENMQRQLDERIEQFQQQVKLVRNDEIAGLTRNAQTLSSFEPSKAVELITEQWKLENGQDEVLKTLEFMDKDAVNLILAAMPNTMIREVLQKRLKVSREPTPSAGAGK